MIIITLPWPDKVLNPNAMRRMQHWGTRSTVGAYAHAGARATTQELLGVNTRAEGQMHPALAECIGDANSVHLTLLACPPTAPGARNLDNILSACKYAIDGIAEALGVDDRIFHPVTLDWGPPDRPNGHVEIRLGPSPY